MSKSQALLFGLNYNHIPEIRLEGCINDVKNLSEYLTSVGISCKTYTDDNDLFSTSAQGIIVRLHESAIDSYRNNLDFLYIHFSGHGTFIRDRNSDETDGRDECLVPSDYNRVGIIPDDIISNLFTQFNPKTKVVCIFDCCCSGTMGDVKYGWEGPTKTTIENSKSTLRNKIITLSACLDTQIALDAYNILGDKKYGGAMTGCLLLSLRENRLNRQNVFRLLEDVKTKLKQRGYKQIPRLCSSYNITRDTVIIPK
jgi:hypothetical protein